MADLLHLQKTDDLHIMTACPTCGHDPAEKHRGELERQFPTFAQQIRAEAERTGEDPWSSIDPESPLLTGNPGRGLSGL